jgi:autotransporter-associated beta strand protein
LTLGTANNFLGPATINAGVVWAANGSAFGATNGTTTIASGATLDLRANNLGDERFIVSGAGVTNGGAIINSAGTPANFWGPKWLTLAGDTTISGFNGRWDICRVGGQLVGNGFTLTKIGPADIDIGNAGETDLGDIYTQQGRLLVDATTTLGRPANLIALAPGTGFQSYANAGNILNKVMFMTNATYQSAGATANGFAGTVTLFGTNTFDTTASSPLSLNNVVSGSGALRKIGPANLFLAEANTFTGPTLVEAGNLALVNNGSIASSPAISLAAGSSLVATSRVDSTLTLSAGQTLSGSGSIVGSLTDATGASILPGGPVTVGTVPVAGNLALNGGAVLDFNLSGVTTEGAGINDLIVVSNDLNLAGITTLRINPLAALDTANPYTLISYSGFLVGDAANFTTVSDSRYNFTVNTAATPGKVQLTAAGASADLTWAGNVPGSETLWNVKNTANWSDGGGASQFYFGDGVTFNDSATTFNVDMAETLVPKFVTFDNAVNYVLTGAGRVSGITGLIKNSAGRTTLANSGLNDYTGPTVINAGTLEVGNGGVTGNLGPGAVTDNGTLAINRSDAVTFGNTITGTGTLEKLGAGVLSLPNNLSGFDGTIVATGGTIRPTTTNGLGTAVGGTVINGGTLDVNGLLLNREAVTVQGAGFGGLGAIINNGAAQQNALTNVIMAGDTTFGGATRWDIRGASAALRGSSFSLTKVSSNDVWLVDVGQTDLLNITVNGGTLGVQGTTALGSEFPPDNLTVNPGATLGLWGLNANILNKPAFFNSGTFNNGNGLNTYAGTVELSGSNAVVAAANTRLTFTEVLSGTGSLNTLGGGTNRLVNANTYTGGTSIGGTSVLELGDGGTTGSIVGNITNNSGLSIYRSDEVPLVNNVSGLGNIAVRTGAGLVVDGSAGINIGGSIEVGRFVPGKMILKDGASVTAGRILLGNPASVTGDVVQEGGDVVVSLEARVGHWPTETSTYLMGGGTLNLTNKPTNPDAEKFGILYIGIDGTGIFTQTGGVVSAHGVVLDNRGDTAGTDTLNLEGGRLIAGPSGIASGNNSANPSYQINLGGGTIASSGNWTSVLNMTLTGTGGSVTFDTGDYTNVLSGALTGNAGGLVKAGAGMLVLGGTDIFVGNTVVNQGTLAVTGTLGAGGIDEEIRVVNGSLAGTGLITNNAIVEAGGTLAPGLSIGTLTFSYSLELSGTTLMEINKSGAALTSDHVQGGNPLTFGGTLNIVASGDPLAAGDAFDLFDTISPGGGFTTVNLPALPAGLAWDTSMLYADGTIKVVAAGGPTINFLLSGSRFEMSWDPLAVGYTLQGQTNPLSQGITTSNWVDVLTGVINNTYVVDPVPTNQNVFFRLLKP